MKKLLLLLLAVAASVALAQASPPPHSAGTLKGTVFDMAGNPVPFANVAVYRNGVLVTGVVADIDGLYLITPVTPGTYEVHGSCLGYDKQVIKNVVIEAEKITFLDLKLPKSTQQLSAIMSYPIPSDRSGRRVRPDDYRFDASKVPSPSDLQRIDIARQPSRDAMGAVQSTNDASLRGSRGAPLIFIDGVKVRGGSGVPQSAVLGVQVIKPVELGSTPANVGDGQSLSPSPMLEAAPMIQAETYYAPARRSFPDPYVNENEYKDFVDNPFLSALQEPLSTFSVDVDKASYALVRKFIRDRVRPPKAVVRLEEMVNYFDYHYSDPSDEHPFRILSEITACPWDKDSRLVKLALQGKRIAEKELPPSVFTFLVDVSGSMESSNKLPLVKASLLKLLDKMRPQDKVGIVVYAGAAGVVLEPQSAGKKSFVVSAILNMQAGGSTAGGAGIQLAYKLAEEHFVKDGNNRIILCTDGDFNVGVSSESDLGALIEKEREKGIFLTVLGYGMGNYKDSKLELLADKGNGNYAYIDDYDEAEKFLGKEFAGSMYTIAKDVKIQVEFNPHLVKSYRLIGYENRVLAAKDFNDDRKDAGEIGAGHTVTALYEIRADEKFVKSVDSLKYRQTAVTGERYAGELATVKFRYKKPDGDKSILIRQTLADQSSAFAQASESTRFAVAVAAFGMKLRGQPYVESLPLTQLIEMAVAARGEDKDGIRQDFIDLLKAYKRLDGIAARE